MHLARLLWQRTTRTAACRDQRSSARRGRRPQPDLVPLIVKFSEADWAVIHLQVCCCPDGVRKLIRHALRDLWQHKSVWVAGTQLKMSTPRSRQVACGATGVQANLFSRFFRVIRSYANSVGMFSGGTPLSSSLLLVKFTTSMRQAFTCIHLCCS